MTKVLASSIAALLFAAFGSCCTPALAQPTDACLTPTTGPQTPMTLRDAKIIVSDVDGLVGPGGLKQTVVDVYGCMILSGFGKSPLLQATYQAVIFSKDGHLLQAASASQQYYRPDVQGGDVSHTPIYVRIGFGYKIDHDRLAKSLTLSHPSVAECTAPGQCSNITYLPTIVAPACLVDGVIPPSMECPSAH